MAELLPISSLNTKSRKMKVHARVVKVWSATNLKTGVLWGMNFVLLDDKGTAIQATAYLGDYQKFSGQLFEGNIVEIGRFKVNDVNVDSGFRSVKNKFSLFFTSETYVNTLSPSLYDIPEYYFDFKELETVGTTITNKNTLLDVIGIISGYTPVQTIIANNKETRIQTIHLKNDRGCTVDLVLWEDFIEKLNVHTLQEKSKKGAVIVACSSLQINEFRGKYGLKTYVGTKFITDSDISPIKEFLQRLSTVGAPMKIESQMIRTSYSSSSQSKEGAKEISIADLPKIGSDNFKDNLWKCTAKIIDINNHFQWSYESCPQCRKKVQDAFLATARCLQCNTKTTNHEPWYRVPVQVQDYSGEAEFVLMGNTANNIIGQDAKTTKKENNPDPELAPPALLKIIGKTYTFMLAAKRATNYQRHNNYTVQDAHEVIGESTNQENEHEKVQDPAMVLSDENNLSLEDDSDLAIISSTPNTTTRKLRRIIKSEPGEERSEVPATDVRKRLNFDDETSGIKKSRLSKTIQEDSSDDNE